MNEEETSHLKAEIARLNKIISVLLEQNDAIKASHSHLLLRFEANQSIDRKSGTQVGMNTPLHPDTDTQTGMNTPIHSHVQSDLGVNTATHSQQTFLYRLTPNSCQ
jgi:hypothetical protein